MIVLYDPSEQGCLVERPEYCRIFLYHVILHMIARACLFTGAQVGERVTIEGLKIWDLQPDAVVDAKKSNHAWYG